MIERGCSRRRADSRQEVAPLQRIGKHGSEKCALSRSLKGTRLA
jgi:hypothetical protein